MESKKESIVASSMLNIKELSLPYDVVRMICQYLNAQNLSTVSLVSRCWRDAANSVTKTRRTPEVFLSHLPNSKTNKSKKAFDASGVSKDLLIKANFGLICAKSNHDWYIKGCYCRNLPKNCKIILAGGYDIVINDEKIDEKIKRGILGGLFLPEVCNLNPSVYSSNDSEFCKFKIEKECTKFLVDKIVSKKESPKCIILLSDGHGYRFIRSMTKKLKNLYSPGSIAIWGGICTDLQVCSKTDTTNKCLQKANWSVITLSGSMCWSMVLTKPVLCEIKIKQKLEEFKNQIKLKKHSLGLMFACCGRLHKKEIEIAKFKEVFPNVPLIGLHGDGEFGLNTLSLTREKTLNYSYSTIFMILTYE